MKLPNSSGVRVQAGEKATWTSTLIRRARTLAELQRSIKLIASPPLDLDVSFGPSNIARRTGFYASECSVKVVVSAVGNHWGHCSAPLSLVDGKNAPQPIATFSWYVEPPFNIAPSAFTFGDGDRDRTCDIRFADLYAGKKVLPIKLVQTPKGYSAAILAKHGQGSVVTLRVRREPPTSRLSILSLDVAGYAVDLPLVANCTERKAK